MKKKIVILSNHHSYTYNLRREVIEALINDGYAVHLVVPYGEMVDKLIKLGCTFTDIKLNQRSINPVRDILLFRKYFSIIKKQQPDIVISYTIKPNVYGGLACRLLDIPFYPNITGLGTSSTGNRLVQKITRLLYKASLTNVKCVFFQNQKDMDYFFQNSIPVGKAKLLPGSGVNLDRFTPMVYPPVESKIKFVFISRIMKEKGIDQYLETAVFIKEKYPETEFHICGACEDDYEPILKKYHDEGTIIYHGMVQDIQKVLKEIHCTVHPTYYPEGISNVLLESAATTRPIITTDHVGCREVVKDGYNGFLVEKKNTKDLIRAMEKFLKLSFKERERMGINGRKHVENGFDRKIVVEAYLKEINKETSKN